MLSIWVSYKIALAVEHRDDERAIKNKLMDAQKILVDLRLAEYCKLKDAINDLQVAFVKGNDIQTIKASIGTTLMRMQQSLLFCNSDDPSKSVLDASIENFSKIFDKKELSEEDMNGILRNLRLIEILIFSPLFCDSKTIDYIRKQGGFIDPTIAAIDNYIKKIR